MILTLLASVLFSPPLQAPAHIIWTVPSPGLENLADGSVPMPHRAILKKGTVVTFQGRIASSPSALDDQNAAVSIRSGSGTRARGSFKGKWSLVWNTSNESTPNAKMTVNYTTTDDAPMSEVARCDVALVDTDPLTVASKANPDGSIHL